MVALHNRKLSDRELFAGVLWTHKEWHAQQDIFRAQLEAEGVDKINMIFRLGRMMEDYQRTQPSMRERQEIRKRIYPPKAASKGPFTEEELTWLLERLDRVNDPLGVGIVEKLKSMRP